VDKHLKSNYCRTESSPLRGKRLEKLPRSKNQICIYIFRVQSGESSPSSSPTDGAGDKTRVNNNPDHLNFYSWKDKNETPLSRGQALLFYKANQEKFEEMESALTGLAFAATSMTVQNMESVISNGKKTNLNFVFVESVKTNKYCPTSESRCLRQWVHCGLRVCRYFQEARAYRYLRGADGGCGSRKACSYSKHHFALCCAKV
jgi:hypothetical protein